MLRTNVLQARPPMKKIEFPVEVESLRATWVEGTGAARCHKSLSHPVIATICLAGLSSHHDCAIMVSIVRVYIRDESFSL